MRAWTVVDRIRDRISTAEPEEVLADVMTEVNSVCQERQVKER